MTNQFFYSKIPYDPIVDCAPVSLISSSASLLTMHPSLPVRSVRDLLALAKVNLQVVHFKGGGPALVATMSGETEVTFSNISETRRLWSQSACVDLASQV